MIYVPLVRSVQTVHLSFVKTETFYHLSFVTYEYHRVCPKWCLSLCYVWHKPWSYLALTLRPSPNGSNEIPHDPRHLCVPSGAPKTISEPMVRLAQTVQLSYINTNTISKRTERDSTWPTSPRSSIRCVQSDFWALGTFIANRAPMLCQDDTISKWAKTSYHLSLVTKE